MTKNIKFRLILGLFSFLVITFYMFGYFLVSSLKRSYLETIDTKLEVILKDIAHDYNGQNDANELLGDAKEEFDIQTLYVQLTKIDIYTRKPLEISISQDLKNQPILLEESTITNLLKTRKIIISYGKHLTRGLRVAHTIINAESQTPSILLCALEYDYHTPYLKQLREWLWFGLSTLLIVVLLTVYFIISKSLANVQKVIEEVNAININQTYKPLTKSHLSPEIDHLIDTFNILLTQLSSAYMQVKQFGNNASHELKTPLTIIRGEIEVGLKKERSSEEYKEILTSIQYEVIGLQSIIEKMLFLSSVSKSEVRASFVEVYIDELIHEILDEKRVSAEQKNLHLIMERCEPLTVEGNSDLLKIVLNNLMDNAIKYAWNNTIVRISLFDKMIQIENCGTEISEEEISHIFERFYRGKHVGNIQGNGLGLTLVKSICDLHGFGIYITRVEQNQTIVTIMF